MYCSQIRWDARGREPELTVSISYLYLIFNVDSQPPDCKYKSLLELLRYMYSDEVNLSGNNVMGVLYLRRNMVPSPANKCTDYLQENMDPSNVFSILPSAKKHEENKLVDQCRKVIDEQTEEAVKSDEFATIERNLLEEVVIRDSEN